MDRLRNANPFSKRETHSRESIITYKVLTILTWLLSVAVTVYYVFFQPETIVVDPKHHHEPQPIWYQNRTWQTGFTLNKIITSLYWLGLFLFQIGYIGHLFSSNADHVNSACAVGSHFIVNNLLHVGWVLLFSRGHFVWSEVMLILNFFNLSSLYFRHNTYPRAIHTPVVSGPLAWTFVAIYWNGAIIVHNPDSLVARIFANVFVWSILVYGAFFIIIYKDYTMGFNLSVLSAALGVGQFLHHVIAFQWIFAFTIMSVLFVLTLVIAVPAWTGREIPFARSADAERAPLLADE
jgi:hypothetical protein